jgi:prepilin-type N-terminal cleavage/methylation domain-containing protein
MNKKNLNNTGFTLIEVMITALILGLAFLGLSSANLYSLKQNKIVEESVSIRVIVDDIVRTSFLSPPYFIPLYFDPGHTGGSGTPVYLACYNIDGSQAVALQNTQYELKNGFQVVVLNTIDAIADSTNVQNPNLNSGQYACNLKSGFEAHVISSNVCSGVCNLYISARVIILKFESQNNSNNKTYKVVKDFVIPQNINSLFPSISL